MANPVVFRVTFELWCATVSKYVKDYGGRELADLPVSVYPLQTWYSRGVSAQVVGGALASLCPPRVTVVRFYTDDRPVQILQQFREKQLKQPGVQSGHPPRTPEPVGVV